MRSLLGRLRPYTPGLLSIAGLALLSVAAGILAVAAGVVAAGLSLLIIGWMVDKP
jgi:hypothetical protein